ncbi:class II glutamine amidotransferase [Agromyces marinus]|uniref:class II glutamine amidotransferase n=1 Tax=Agromyces marinus TaxID=1389020 RepID=UPI001F32E3DB|nr:class II glutamine amidotransferase [Agromyces marinus]UIP60041.1 Gamma-glutamyl-hercynylcysteine sulfoxide hydrolase [Agromyces marinus]
MCRWLAYSGEPLRTSAVILDAKHSLVAQSLDSPLGAETVNGDGFGIGWYPVGSEAGTHPAVFHSIEPAWNDDNVRELTRAVESPLFFSHVRAAAGPPIQRTNCHPFRWENWLFMHNGFLAEFSKVARDLAFAIDPSLYPHVRGTTDSEVLFHLAITFGLADDPVGALTAAVDHVERVGREHGILFPVQGTIAVADGATIWALRYSSQGESRTLFHSVDVPTLRRMYPDADRLTEFGDTAHVVVSEPLNDLPGVFVEVPEATIAVLDREGYHHEPFRTAA